MPKPQRSITVLFEWISEGDREAFNELFLGYYDKLVSFTKHYVRQAEIAEEISSELFVKIWLKREAMRHILKPEVYLYISAKNAALNHLRNAKKHNISSPGHESMEVLTLADNDSSAMERKELIRKLDESIVALPEQRQIIFRLIKEDGLKSKEVAAILNISVRTVENQMYKAVKKLADTLSDYLGYHPQHRISKKNPLSGLPILFFF